MNVEQVAAEIRDAVYFDTDGEHVSNPVPCGDTGGWRFDVAFGGKFYAVTVEDSR